MSNVVRLVPAVGDEARDEAIVEKASVEAMIGAALRIERLRVRMSQENLGDGVGVSFQQVQKWEQGKNRISVSRLLTAAAVIGFDPGVFVTDLYDGTLTEGAVSARAEAAKNFDTLGVLELCRLFNAMTAKQRKVVLSLMRELAGDDG